MMMVMMMTTMELIKRKKKSLLRKGGKYVKMGKVPGEKHAASKLMPLPIPRPRRPEIPSQRTLWRFPWQEQHTEPLGMNPPKKADFAKAFQAPNWSRVRFEKSASSMIYTRDLKQGPPNTQITQTQRHYQSTYLGK